MELFPSNFLFFVENSECSEKQMSSWLNALSWEILSIRWRLCCCGRCLLSKICNLTPILWVMGSLFSKIDRNCFDQVQLRLICSPKLWGSGKDLGFGSWFETSNQPSHISVYFRIIYFQMLTQESFLQIWDEQTTHPMIFYLFIPFADTWQENPVFPQKIMS